MQRQKTTQPVVAERKLVRKQQPTIQSKAAEFASAYLQAAAARLAMSKVEADAKQKLMSLMEENDLLTLDGQFLVGTANVNFSANINVASSTVIDVEELTKHLTPDQFLQCAKVTLSAAKQVLPQSVIDQCSTVVQGEPSLKITAKGVPTPVTTIL